jgi:hypothetical protein
VNKGASVPKSAADYSSFYFNILIFIGGLKLNGDNSLNQAKNQVTESLMPGNNNNIMRIMFSKIKRSFVLCVALLVLFI